jgi:hypothetical protein
MHLKAWRDSNTPPGHFAIENDESAPDDEGFAGMYAAFIV